MSQKKAPVPSGSLKWMFNFKVVVKFFIVDELDFLCIWLLRVSNDFVVCSFFV
jgi:hypothetical protein